VDDEGGCEAGGIRQLIELIGEHPDAFAYDWRTRFGLPLESIFDGRMSWNEAATLTRTLTADPTSRVGAALQGWQYPVSHDAVVLMDLYDLTLAAVPKKKSDQSKLKPYPRPWPQESDAIRSEAPTVSQEQIRKALAARGH
jgi:hypothetical protein